jgi:endonuclease-8
VPEGDTVHVAARKLHRALAAQRIERSDFRVPRFATTDLRGQTVREVDARGKHILMRTDAGVTVHSHFAMEGEWRIYAANARARGPNHEMRAVLDTERARAVGYRLAILEVLRTANEDDVVGHLGPDPLRADWDAAEAARRMKQHGGDTISDALLDQTIVAGWGNVYRNEINFLRGHHPERLVRDCDVEATIALGARLLRANRERAGQVTTGNLRDKNWVYSRARLPCMRCGATIEKRNDTARVTYWCPACQPG